jgi:uncharacterized repeat protein (TIGR01451 family)
MKSNLFAKRLVSRTALLVEAAALCVCSTTAMAAVVDSPITNIAVPATSAGIYINVVTGVSNIAPASAPGWDLNPWGTTQLNFFAATPAGSHGSVLTGSGGTINPLAVGATVSVADFFGTTQPANGSGFRGAQDAYMGFRFVNENTGIINYGYARLTTSLPAGHPAVVVCARYEDTGAPITVAACGAGGANTAPTLTYSPTTAAGVTFPTGPAGSVNSTIAITSAGAAGTGQSAVTGCAITGAGAASFGAVTTTPANGIFNTATTTGSINLSCTRGAAAATASLACTETATPTVAGSPFTRTWALTCPAATPIPNMDVTPASLTATAPANQTTTAPLTIANTGQGTLTWNITEEPVGQPQSTPGGRGAASDARDEAPNANKPVELSAFVPPSGPIWRAPNAVLFDNGPLVTNPGAGAGGANVSALQLTQSTFGFGHAVTSGFRMADDFVVGGSGWLINTVTFFAYQTGSTTTSTINAVNVRIWNGPPGAPGSAVVFGDTTTNRLVSSTYSGINRTLGTALTDGARPIMASTVSINTFLPAGTYWFDWQTGGTLASGPWAPAVTIAGQLAKPGANGLQFDPTAMTWNPALDTGAAAQQDLPFVIDGLADCANPSDVPWLSLSPTNGSNAAGTNTVVTATFNATGLAVGTYNARLCVVSNDPDTGPGNGTGLVVVPVAFTVIEQADLVMTLTDAPDPVTAGTNLTYTAMVANTGPTAANNVSFSMPAPAGTTLVSATPTAGGNCTAASPVTCTWAGSTAAGASHSATIIVAVPASAASGTTLTATATAASPTADPNPANNAATTTTSVITSADLQVSLTSSVTASPINVPVTFTATSLNIGPSDAQNVSVTITLTPDFRYSSHSAAGATCTVPQVGNTGAIVCTWAGATAPGASRTMSVVAFSNVQGPTAVNASTTSGTTDPVAGNNSNGVTVQVGYLVEEIPTLGNLGLLLMGLMIGLMGFVAVRRQS